MGVHGERLAAPLVTLGIRRTGFDLQLGDVCPQSRPARQSQVVFALHASLQIVSPVSLPSAQREYISVHWIYSWMQIALGGRAEVAV